MLSSDGDAKEKALAQSKPRLRLEFSTDDLERLIAKGESILEARRAVDKEREERERQAEQKRWSEEAEAAAKGF